TTPARQGGFEKGLFHQGLAAGIYHGLHLFEVFDPKRYQSPLVGFERPGSVSADDDGNRLCRRHIESGDQTRLPECILDLEPLDEVFFVSCDCVTAAHLPGSPTVGIWKSS